MPGYNVEEEIELLAGHIKRLGRQEADGYQVTFKVSPKILTQDKYSSRMSGTV